MRKGFRNNDIAIVIEHRYLWATQENAQEILQVLSAFFVDVEEEAEKNKESEMIEKDVQRTIEVGQDAIKVPLQSQVREDQLNESHGSHDDRNRYLKLLRV